MKPVLFLILFLLVVVFTFQIFWIRAYYNDQSAKLELNILSAMRTANDLLIYQKGRQTNVIELSTVDFPIYNDLLQVELMQRELTFDSFTEMVNLKQNKVMTGTSDMVLIPEKTGYKAYTYLLDLEEVYAYRLFVKNPNLFLLKQMSGVLGTSLLMILVLIFSYIYLLRIIYRQKTLDEIKSDFINNMTHELKTPISIVYATIDALLDYGMIDVPEKREIYLNASRKQLKHLSGLVEQILSMSVEERKNMNLSPVESGLSDLFFGLKQQYMLHSTKHIDIQIRVEPDDLSIPADEVHFRNVMSNLIENSIKYSGESVTIFLKAERKQNKVFIEIQDDGVGIPASALPKLFDRFYRVPTGDIHDVKGYGLGLYYVKSIVDKHHWTIEVKSKVKEGTSFIITIVE